MEARPIQFEPFRMTRTMKELAFYWSFGYCACQKLARGAKIKSDRELGSWSQTALMRGEKQQREWNEETGDVRRGNCFEFGNFPSFWYWGPSPGVGLDVARWSKDATWAPIMDPRIESYARKGLHSPSGYAFPSIPLSKLMRFSTACTFAPWPCWKLFMAQKLELPLYFPALNFRLENLAEP